MVVPIVCREPGCAGAGETVNEVSGINPQDLDDFYEAFGKPDPEDHCTLCGRLGIAEDPRFEHEWERKYYDRGTLEA